MNRALFFPFASVTMYYWQHVSRLMKYTQVHKEDIPYIGEECQEEQQTS